MDQLHLKFNRNKHNFHIVDVSPWPLFCSIGAFSLVLGLAARFHNYMIYSYYLIYIGILLLIFCSFLWLRDVVRESFLGYHSIIVQSGLRMGIILFIVTEIMFFFAFFWAFFHSSLVPTVEIGCIWPPEGITIMNPLKIPLLNTFILLTSGATLTWTHYEILKSNFDDALKTLTLTVVLGLVFECFQYLEYLNSSFSINDGIYGSTFYMLTGLHGAHVLIGIICLTICLVRLKFNQFTNFEHVSFEGAAWYWHFVDVVWIILFITVYYWSSLEPISEINFYLN